MALSLAAGWATLPPELQAAVLAKLPLQQRAAVRSVCHAWKAWLDEPQHWADVRRLSLSIQVPPSDAPLPSMAQILASNEVHDRKQSQLVFLAPRCPLLSLEIHNEHAMSNGLLAALPATTRLARLRTLVLDDGGFYMYDELAAFIGNQPQLHTLVLGHYTFTHYIEGDFLPAEMLAALERLETLRVLAIDVTACGQAAPPAVRDLPARLLRRLDCLSVCYDTGAEEAETKAGARDQVRAVKNVAPLLKLRRHDYEASERWLNGSRLLWAKEGFRWESVMAGEGRYSRNFLLDWNPMG